LINVESGLYNNRETIKGVANVKKFSVQSIFEFTDEILEYALDITKKYDAELHLIHIIPNLNYLRL